MKCQAKAVKVSRKKSVVGIRSCETVHYLKEPDMKRVVKW